MRISQELCAFLQLVVRVPIRVCGRGCERLRVWLLGAERVQRRVVCLRGGSSSGACVRYQTPIAFQATRYVSTHNACAQHIQTLHFIAVASAFSTLVLFFLNSYQGYLTDAGGLVQISVVSRYTSSSPLCAAAANGVVPRPVDVYVDTSFRLFPNIGRLIRWQAWNDKFVVC